MTHSKIIALLTMFIAFLLFVPSSTFAIILHQNDNFQETMDDKLSKFLITDVIGGGIEIKLNLKIDGRVEYKFTEKDILRQLPSDKRVLVLFRLNKNDSYQDIKILTSTKDIKKEYSGVSILDTENCEGEYIFNPVLKQLLICNYPVLHNESKIELQATLMPEKIPEICPKPIDRVFKNLTFEFLVYKNLIYPVNIQVTADPELKILVPNNSKTEINGQELTMDITEFQNGYLIEALPQYIGKDVLELNMMIVGLIRTEIEKQQEFEVNKTIVVNKYNGQITVSVIFSIFLIAISYIYKKIKVSNNKIKISELIFHFALTVILGTIVKDNFTTFYQDVTMNYVNWWFAVLPSIIGIVSIMISFIMILKIRGKASITWI